MCHTIRNVVTVLRLRSIDFYYEKIIGSVDNTHFDSTVKVTTSIHSGSLVPFAARQLLSRRVMLSTVWQDQLRF